MKTIKARELTLEAFERYGTFADLLNPNGDFLGGDEDGFKFFRDRLTLTAPGEMLGLSVTKVQKRPLVIETAEYHDHCGEGILPINGDVYIHVAPATPHDEVPYGQFEVFRVPQGTAVVLKPGVWHHAPFAVSADSVSNLCLLPERTYAADCCIVSFPEEEKLAIE